MSFTKLSEPTLISAIEKLHAGEFCSIRSVADAFNADATVPTPSTQIELLLLNVKFDTADETFFIFFGGSFGIADSPHITQNG